MAVAVFMGAILRVNSRLSSTAKKKLFLLAKIVITFVFPVYVLSMVSFQDISLKIRSINLYYMPGWLCLFFYFSGGAKCLFHHTFSEETPFLEGL